MIKYNSQEILCSVLGSREKGQGLTIDREVSQYTHDLKYGMIQPCMGYNGMRRKLLISQMGIGEGQEVFSMEVMLEVSLMNTKS